MATHKSAEKRNRQSIKKGLRNSTAKAALRTAAKRVRTAMEQGDMATAKKLLVVAEAALSSAATKGIIHPKNAMRKTSRLASLVNAKTK
jgi:small subunit ribosomal protein S20